MSTEAPATEPTTVELLEFDLGSETYGVDIQSVAEVVTMEETTGLPDAPPHLVGVMDLRGTTTAIVDPKTVFGLEGEHGGRVIVFDDAAFDDGRPVGWVVDEVSQVVQVDPETVEEAPVDEDAIRGVVRRSEEFVIWVDPTTATA